MKPADHPFNVTAIPNPDFIAGVHAPHRKHKYQVMYGSFFGFSRAVVEYNRWPKLIVSLQRRWLALITVMYYDDEEMVDLACAGGDGQRYARSMFHLCGARLAPQKARDLAPSSEFLGSIHHVGEAFTRGVASIEPREVAAKKAIGLADDALNANFLGPGEASKLRGVVSSFCFGDGGGMEKIALGPIKQRQYYDTPPFTLSHQLVRALRLVNTITLEYGSRQVKIYPSLKLPLVCASDARMDEEAPPSGAVLLEDPASGLKRAWIFVASQDLMALWAHDATIATMECAMVVAGMLSDLRSFTTVDVIWFIDNSVALSCLVKGGGSTEALHRASAAPKCLMHFLQSRIWFEYVESKANWSDSASRDLEACKFCSMHNFPIFRGRMPKWPWTVPLDELVAKAKDTVLEQRW